LNSQVAQHLQRSLPGAVSLRSLTLYFMVDPSDKCYLWYGHRLLLSATHDIESFAHALLTSPLNDLLISPQVNLSLRVFCCRNEMN
jgi:hypothetical protein